MRAVQGDGCCECERGEPRSVAPVCAWLAAYAKVLSGVVTCISRRRAAGYGAGVLTCICKGLTSSLACARIKAVWACGAAGSALPWHGRGRRFDPDQVHHFFSTVYLAL